MAGSGNPPHRLFGSQDDCSELAPPDRPLPQHLGIELASESDDDAPPETVSLQSAKDTDQLRVLKEHEVARRRKASVKAREAEMQARKLKRERQVLQQQKKTERNFAKNKKKRNKSENFFSARDERKPIARDAADDDDMRTQDQAPIDDEARARMERVMAQAKEESGEERPLYEDEGHQTDWEGVDPSCAVEADYPPRDHKRHRQRPKASLHHLPDAIFLSAAKAFKTQSNGESSLKPGETYREERGAPRHHKPQQPRASAKDMIVGSRTLRPVAFAAQIASEYAFCAPKTTRYFISRQLNSKGSNRQWQRKSAHLALHSRTGPARIFTAKR
ncbi:hypothetical protein FRB96_001244 [Tulasnella sp. 330]|nr:hypothetical protein FRB96_001244 [Tulasnella sp. 330]KAG8883363.1 hypothetical protein FRB97_006788 [Tulasnella sp. 331]KAG8888731.1 hypothetical protein FRB98_006988 [Tulasnella sp. 332]